MSAGFLFFRGGEEEVMLFSAYEQTGDARAVQGKLPSQKFLPGEVTGELYDVKKGGGAGGGSLFLTFQLKIVDI